MSQSAARKVARLPGEKRTSFTVPRETQVKLNEIKAISGESSNIDVIRNALILYEDYVKSPREGFVYVRRAAEKSEMPVFLSSVVGRRQN